MTVTDAELGYQFTHAATYDYDRRVMVLACGKIYDEATDGTTRIAGFVTCSECAAALPTKHSH